MKNLCTLLFLVCSTSLLAQETDDGSFENWAFGFNINEFHQDFGVGLQAVSPFFGKKVKAAVRGVYNFQYLQHLNSAASSTWTPYKNAQLGIKFASPIVSDHFRYYGEAGGIGIFPNEEFSSSSSEWGLYGIFGFEFLFGNLKGAPRGYFIELGAVGTGANADRVPGNPIYSNGFLISVGLRFYHRSRS